MIQQLIFACLILTSSCLFAEVRYGLELSQGYRHDNLHVKAKRESEGVCRKKHFKEIDVYTSRLGAYVEKHGYFLKGVAGYGHIYDGHFHEIIDYKERHYHDIHSKKSHLTDHYTADFEILLGKHFELSHGWGIAPSLGYSVYVQKFETGHTREEYHAKDRYFGKEHHKRRGKKEEFRATWYSPEVGLQASKAFCEALKAYVHYTFLYPMNYHAKGREGGYDGNVHYNQENKAYKSFGQIGTLGVVWNFWKGWALKPEFELMKFYSKGGDSHHHLHLDKVKRTAYELRLNLGYSF